MLLANPVRSAPVTFVKMSAVAVREAVRKDLATILELYRELRPNDPVLSNTQASESKDHLLSSPGVRVIVAEQAGVVVSSCMLAMISNLANGGRAHLASLSILSRQAPAAARASLAPCWSMRCNWRGRKIATRLFSCQEPSARRHTECTSPRVTLERGFAAKPGILL